MLRWTLLLLSLATVGSLAGSATIRRHASELLRDLSDRFVMGLLRATSGFADDVSPTLREEERERRLRWR